MTRRFVTTLRIEYEAHHSGDAEHLAALMVARLDDLTPHSTNVRIEDWPSGHKAAKAHAEGVPASEGHDA